MTPELPPPPERDSHPPGDDDRFGPEAVASIERSLAHVQDPDDALRILRGVKENGAAFGAYLMLIDTDLVAENLMDRFHDSYVDGWESFAEFRRDVLDGLGWLDAVKQVMTVQGIPEDHLVWNQPAIDERILDTYDAVRLDGWWHVFYK
jgi:hypothetical protein